MDLLERIKTIEGNDEEKDFVKMTLKKIIPGTITFNGEFPLTARKNGDGIDIYPSRKGDSIVSGIIECIVERYEENPGFRSFISPRGYTLNVYNENRD